MWTNQKGVLLDCKRSIFQNAPKKDVKLESNIWYTKIPFGKNTLRNVVANLCKEAEIGGYKTNHSLRATACSLGLTMGVPDKINYGKNWA